MKRAKLGVIRYNFDVTSQGNVITSSFNDARDVHVLKFGLTLIFLCIYLERSLSAIALGVSELLYRRSARHKMEI